MRAGGVVAESGAKHHIQRGPRGTAGERAPGVQLDRDSEVRQRDRAGAGEHRSHARVDDRQTGRGSDLSTLGAVKLGSRGIIEGNQGKSGWITIDTTGSYVDATTGARIGLLIKGVSFWVNEGGGNWWDFEVGQVVLARNTAIEVPYAVSVEKLSPWARLTTGSRNIPVLTIRNKYRLAPAGNLNNITFKQEGP